MDEELERIAKIPISVVVIHFFIFFFTGLYLGYRRNSNSWDYAGNSKRMKVCGWILIIFAILLTISVIPDTNMQNYIAIWVVWGLSGYYTIFRANRIIKKANKYFNLYNPPVVNNNDYNIDINIHTDYILNDDSDYDSKPAANPQYKVVICPSCGAKMKVAAGSVVKCEYCDTPLE